MAKVDLHPDFREFFESLNSAKVKYLIVGGYAVNLYGHHRMTKDVDVWVATDGANASKLVRVMKEWGGDTALAVDSSLFRRPRQVLMLGVPPTRIDVLTSIDGVDFEDCYTRRKPLIWDGVPVSVIDLADLLANKSVTGRTQDRSDVERLTRLSALLEAKRLSAGSKTRNSQEPKSREKLKPKPKSKSRTKAKSKRFRRRGTDQ